MNPKWYTVLVMFCMAGFLVLAPSANAQTYVGPEKCLTCHGAIKKDASGWRTSMHANGYSVVLDDSHTMQDKLGMVNDVDQNGTDDFKDGLDFNTISSAFDPYKPNAPVLAYSAATGYTITIGARTHKVYMTYGGSGLYKQRYVVKIATDEGESNDYYVSPIQYNEKTHEYVLYHPDAWYDASSAPIDYSTRALASTNSRSLAKGCSGCHVTGLELQQDANGEWLMSGGGVEDETLYADKNNVFDIDGDGDLDQINTGCERCHGPGGDHVALPVKTNIINPEDDLTVEQANNMCGMCHSRGKSLPNHTFGFPFDDQNLQSWAPGDMVADIYSDGNGLWPDEATSVKHHQQYTDFIKSSMPANGVACYSCHDVHNGEKHHIRRQVTATDSLGAPIVIATDNDDNTLCLSCHATTGDFAAIPVEWVADAANHTTEIGAVVSQHTRHPYDPTGTGASRCSKCHNPKAAKSAVPYDIHAHTFEVVSPEKTLFYQADGGMPNSCATSCHMKDGFPQFGIDMTANTTSNWTEAADVALADSLMHYYGPGGIWWDTGNPLAVEESPAGLVPTTYALSQNFPNPFNPSTTIAFNIAKAGFVRLNLYNILGQKIATLVNENLQSGNYRFNFDASGLSSGVYIYRLEVNGFAQSKKMVFSK